MISQPGKEYKSHQAIMIKSVSIYSGGYWLSDVSVMKLFTSEYNHYLQNIMDERLANCEEQVRQCVRNTHSKYLFDLIIVGDTMQNVKLRLDFYNS